MLLLEFLTELMAVVSSVLALIVGYRQLRKSDQETSKHKPDEPDR